MIRSPFTHAYLPAALSILTLFACGKRGAPDTSASAEETAVSAETHAATPPAGNAEGSCETTDGRCLEYLDTSAFNDARCRASKGTFSKSRCRRDDLMGVCERGDLRTFTYYGGQWLDQVTEDCEKELLGARGRFIAEPNAEQLARERAIPSPERIKARCLMKSGDRCSDFLTVSTSEPRLCELGKGTFSEEPCPTEKLVASCPSRSSVQRYYTTSKSTLKTFQKECESSLINGHWYPASP